MREAVRGYASGIAQGADRESVSALKSDLAAITNVLRESGALKDVLQDGGLSVAVRSGIASDLWGTAISEPAMRLISFCVAAEPAAELYNVLESLVDRFEVASDQMSDQRSDQGLSAPLSEGSVPVELDPAVGKSGLKERIEGYSIERFETLADRSVLDEVEDGLFRFARTVQSARNLGDVLGDPTLPASVRQSMAKSLIEGRVPELALDLVSYAVANTRGRELVAMLDWAVELTASERGRRVADVRTAVGIDSELAQTIRASLRVLTNREVELRLSEDPSLMGGMVVVVGNLMVDTSIRHRLDNLKTELLHADLGTGSGPAPHNQRGEMPANG